MPARLMPSRPPERGTCASRVRHRCTARAAAARPAPLLPNAARAAAPGRLPAVIAASTSAGPHTLIMAPSLTSPGSAR